MVLFYSFSVFPFCIVLDFSVFFDRFILTFFIRFVFLPVSPWLSVVLLSLLPLHFSFCHVFWFFTPPLLSFLIFSSICTSFFLSPRLSLFLASLQSHKIWSWLSIYSARGSVAMTTKLEARAPGSYFWSSAVMLDTAFSSALSLSVFLSLSLPFCCFFCLSLSHCVHCSLFSPSLCFSLCPSLFDKGSAGEGSGSRWPLACFRLLNDLFHPWGRTKSVFWLLSDARAEIALTSPKCFAQFSLKSKLADFISCLSYLCPHFE